MNIDQLYRLAVCGFFGILLFKGFHFNRFLITCGGLYSGLQLGEVLGGVAQSFVNAPAVPVLVTVVSVMVVANLYFLLYRFFSILSVAVLFGGLSGALLLPLHEGLGLGVGGVIFCAMAFCTWKYFRGTLILYSSLLGAVGLAVGVLFLFNGAGGPGQLMGAFLQMPRQYPMFTLAASPVFMILGSWYQFKHGPADEGKNEERRLFRTNRKKEPPKRAMSFLYEDDKKSTK